MTIDHLPDVFLARLKELFNPEDYAQYLNAVLGPRRTAFRVNTLKITTQDAIAALNKANIEMVPIEWCPNAFSVDSSVRRQLTNTSLFMNGEIYIQNPSSLFASLVLDPTAGDEVLDMAAAPGGKTLHMAALMGNQGRIAAVELVKNRFFKLCKNIANANATLVKTYNKDSVLLGRKIPERFDKIMLDAPCSSESRFDVNDPKSYAFWSEKKIKEMNRKQKQLIYSAIQCLKPGGVLTYCTCSFAPEENEEVVNYALSKFPEQIELLEIAVPFNNYRAGLMHWRGQQFSDELSKTVRIIPTNLMAGFYLAKIKKN